MGGHVFPTAAARQTTAQLDALTARTLAPLLRVFARVERLACFGDKATHGDLDLVCAWAGWERGRICGRVDGAVGRGADGELDKGSSGEAGGDAGGGAGGGAGGEAADEPADEPADGGWDRKAWAEGIARSIGGTQFSFDGPYVFVMVPCTLVEPGMVDCILVPPARFAYVHQLHSYGITRALLDQVAAALSPSLVFTRTRFMLRHVPCPGLAAATVDLSVDFAAVLAWLELDAARFARGFEDERALLVWLADAAPDSRVAPALVALAGREQRQVHKGKDGAVAALQAHLRTTHWAAVPPPVLAPPTPPASPPAANLDPERFVELDNVAAAALAHFGGAAEYAGQLEARRAEAVERRDRQLRKERNRAAHAQRTLSKGV